MHDAMASLPENCREILDRFFAQDESYRTIGEALEPPAGTIASRISRCLEKLKAVLEENPSPPVLKSGDSMNASDHDALARLIAALPPAPRGWVQAAQELPAARRGIDDIVERAVADAAYRERVVADLESALADVGIIPTPPVLEELRERFRLL